MSARLVSLALSYAIGGGVLRSKGIKQRSWLELKRLETERTYMLHQVKSLQRAGAGPLRVVVDMLPGQHFYDICRARLQHDGFDRAIELLCPDGTPRLNGEILEITGGRGLASLWLDLGRWDKNVAVIPLPTPQDAEALAARLGQLGLSGIARSSDRTNLRLSLRQFGQFVDLIRPHVHRSMSHVLKEQSVHGEKLMKYR